MYKNKQKKKKSLGILIIKQNIVAKMLQKEFNFFKNVLHKVSIVEVCRG